MAQCPFCHHDNPSAADRCAGCGAALTSIAESREDDHPYADSTAASPNQPLEERVLELLAAGRKIEAVKIYREATGAGLAEAKDAVEAIERGQTPLASGRASSNGDEFHRALEKILRDSGLIAAIKFDRQRTGRGLKESKDFVEAFARQRGIPMKQAAGCGATVVVAMAAALVAWWLSG